MTEITTQAPVRLREWFFDSSTWILRYTSGAVQVFLQTYYPLIYLADVAAKFHSDDEDTLKGKSLALLVVSFGCYRSLKLYFPCIHIWPWEEHRGNGRKNVPSMVDVGLDEESPGSFEKLETVDIDHGLTNAEAMRRRWKYGKNEFLLRESWMQLAVEYILRSGNVLSEVAIFTAAFRQEWLKSLSLLLPAALNNGVQLYQQKNANNVSSSLVSGSSTRAVVVRDGTIRGIAASELVPGDVVHISENQSVPADVRIVQIDSSALTADQSSITGESEAIQKLRGDVCYSTTGILSGGAFAVVIATGYQTFIGRMFTLVRGAKAAGEGEDEDLEKAVGSIGIVLWITVLAGALATLGRKLLTLHPEALRLLVSCTMICIYANARGFIINLRACTAAVLTRKGAVVQSMPSIDLLSEIDVLCSDTRGTLTENRLIVVEPYCFNCDAEDLMLAASLTTPWESNSRDAIDNAILNSLRHYPQAREQLIRHKLLDFEPFSPETKQIWSLVEDADGEHLTCIRGAPKACLETWLADNMDHPNKADVVEQYREACKSLATSGLQCLGILRKHENEQWQLMGILPLDDPIRWNAASAIRYANELGIQVKAMTGHTEVIAQEIALKVGLNDQVLSLEGFHGKHANDATADSSMNVAIGGATYFCSVSPDDKVKICRTLQETGILIAMTGDGVSDAPCLRLAHCGIAVEGASERAQAAANVVFLEPGISAHVAAISAARRYFRLMETFLTHRSAFSIGLIVLVFLFYHKFGEYLDPEYLFSIFCLEDLVQAVYLQEPEHDDAPIEKKPTRLRLEKVWSLSGPLCIAVVGMMITVLELFERPSTARKILYLPIICASHWSFLFVYTRGHYQFYSRLWRAFSPLLGSQIAACLFHGFVWRSESGPLSLVTVSGERLAIASSLATIWQCWLIWRN